MHANEALLSLLDSFTPDRAKKNFLNCTSG